MRADTAKQTNVAGTKIAAKYGQIPSDTQFDTAKYSKIPPDTSTEIYALF